MENPSYPWQRRRTWLGSPGQVFYPSCLCWPALSGKCATKMCLSKSRRTTKAFPETDSHPPSHLLTQRLHSQLSFLNGHLKRILVLRKRLTQATFASMRLTRSLTSSLLSPSFLSSLATSSSSSVCTCTPRSSLRSLTV